MYQPDDDVTDRFREIFRQGVDAAVVADPETGEILAANERFEQTFATTPNLEGRFLSDLVREGHLDHRVAELLSHGSGAERDEQFTARSGDDVRHYDAAVRLVRIDDRPCVMCRITDTPAQAAAFDEQRIEAQKADAIGRIASSIAHDFNNLLAVIVSYAEFIGEELDDDELSMDIQQILEAAVRASDLSRKFLGLGRKNVTVPVAVDLNEAIRDLTPLLSTSLGKQHVLEVDLADDLPPIFIDPSHLDQILVNFIVNARDAMSSQTGVARIETAFVSPFDADGDTPGVRLSVVDTGPGIPPDLETRVFEPFFTTKHDAGHSGLGLATIQAIVERGGGKIEVQSDSSGTRFDCYLPGHADPTEVEELSEVSEIPASGPGTFLVVDDEDDVRSAMVRILSGRGHQVRAAGSAEEARSIARNLGERLEVLVTDCTMPGTTGIKLAAGLLEEFPHLRVVYVSGYSESLLSFQALLDHGDLVLKPFRKEALYCTAEEQLIRARQSRGAAHE